MTIKEHPIMIIGRVFKYMVISAVPIVGLELSIELLFFWESFIIALGFCMHRAVAFSFDAGKINFKKGLFFKKNITADSKRITVVSIKSFAPFRLAKMKISYGGGGRRDKISLILTENNAYRFCESFFGKRKGAAERSEKRDIFALSFFLANSFAGAIGAATFFVSLFRVIGSDLRKSLVEVLNEIGAVALLYTTPVSMLIISIVLSSWLFSLISGILGYSSFKREENNSFIKISHGWIFKKETVLRKDSIIYTAAVSTMPSALFRFRSEFSACPGFYRKANFYPVSRPRYKGRGCFEGFKVGRVISYLYKPLLALFLLSGAYILLMERVTLFKSTLKTLFIFAAVAAIWRIIFALAASFFSGASIKDGLLRVRTSSGFLYYDCFFTTDKITAVSLLEPAFNFHTVTGTVFYTEADRGGKVKLRYMKKDSLKEILRKLELDCCKSEQDIV